MAGECNILICTDAAMRGFDIPSVDLVIYYDIPTDVKVRLAIFVLTQSRATPILWCNIHHVYFYYFLDFIQLTSTIS